VRYQNAPLKLLNELEYVGGDLLANVYGSDWIARIDLTTGEVRDMLDLAELYPKRDRAAWTEVMNGIATDGKGRFFLTGKLWPKLFEVRLRGFGALN
jgi:glutamine cyclotransferase